ncbi:MAG: hypothetical protein JNJ58_14390 [Chitinophagaceae bacterium]|nr:hypothetical protein [Chitinophagaceae bacterium]
MNIKRIFAALLTLLGIVGLIVAAVMFIDSSGSTNRDVKTLVILTVLGLVFFIAGIQLVRTTKDES